MIEKLTKKIERKMKKQILLMTAFLCAISLGFTSCDDDEDIHYANVQIGRAHV